MVDEVQPRPEDLRFGEALEELDGIVRALEAGQLDLEESLEVYQRGVAVLKAAQGKLVAAEQKVTMLLGELESEDGASEAPA